MLPRHHDLEDIGRPSFLGIADALAMEFGGAQGLASILKQTMLDSRVRPTSKTKIVQFIINVFDKVSKVYGDRDKIRAMPTEHIKHRILTLLKEHDYTVPIPGIELREKNPDGTAQEASAGIHQDVPGIPRAADVQTTERLEARGS